MNDGARDGNALTLAAGEQVRAMVGARGKADFFEGLGYPLAAYATVDAWIRSGYSTFSAAVKHGI